MKQMYFLIIAMLSTALSVNAQTTVTVDGSANWLGFANVFETPANGGGYVFGSGWGVPDLKSTIGVADDTVTLQPNFNTYNASDPFWVNQSTGEGNKDFEGNTFLEDPSLVGAPFTFTGNVTSNTLDGAYEAVAFIKVFNSNFSYLKIETAPLIEGEDFVVEYTNVEGSDAVVQYGFFVRGLVANPANEAALGSIIVTVGSDCDQDGILNASDPVENYIVSGPSDTFTGTPSGAVTCEAFVIYDPVTATNLCDGMDTFTITQTAGLPSGSNFPVGVTTNTFEIVNAAGTMETYSFDVTVSDTSAPIFECPSDFAVSADDSGTYTIEDYSSTASDNCDAALVVVQEPAAGTVINDGDVQEIIVTATDEAGNVSSCSFTITVDATLSTDDLEIQNAIVLYPNPAINTLTIDIKNNILEDVAIFNTLGAKTLESASSTIDVSNLTTGIYFAQIKTNVGVVTKRFIIRR